MKMASKKLVVGIFSREQEDMYKWLLHFLLTISKVKDVRPVYISNDFHAFQKEAFKCNFAILYHSNNRRQRNATDVRDSLYDKELEYLNRTLEKKKVLVLIDDLEDSSDDIKFQILENQPKIRQLSLELFIFSTAEKFLLSASDEYLSHPELKNKMVSLKKLITAGKATKKKRRPVREVIPISEENLEQNADSGSGDFPGTRTRSPLRPIYIILIFILLLLVIMAIILATTLPQ